MSSFLSAIGGTSHHDDAKFDKVNIDELYEQNRQRSLKQLELYNGILRRINAKIKATSRNVKNDRCCWVTVPEFIFGAQYYDQAGCIAYVMDELVEMGFKIRFIYPNMIFITWAHWVPSYVRAEVKKKTGLKINELGEVIPEEEDEEGGEEGGGQYGGGSRGGEGGGQNGGGGGNKQYTPIDMYKPSGNLVYNNSMLKRTIQGLNRISK